MNQPLLSLIVIRSANIEAALTFYKALGLHFKKERHGSGPAHYACENKGIVFEIYPARNEQKESAADSTLIGFKVRSLEAAIDNLRKSGTEFRGDIKISEHGRRINVSDPDGRTVQISESLI